MKTLQGISITLIGAVALIISASKARAVSSDDMFLYDGTTQIEQASATETTEIAKQGATGLPLFNFNSFANALAAGHYIAIADPSGAIMDVIGVTTIFGPANFAYLSDAGQTPLTAGQILAAGFFAQDGLTLVEDPVTGIFLDSATNPFMLSYIDLTKLPNGRLTFFSDGAPDGGSAVALLGIALAAIEGLRRKIGARKA